MTIIKSNYKIEVENVGKGKFEIKRIGKGRIITAYARRKDVENKIALLSYTEYVQKVFEIIDQQIEELRGGEK